LTAELTGGAVATSDMTPGLRGYDRRKYGKKRPWFVGEVTTSYHGNTCENLNKVRIDCDWSLLQHLG